MIQGNYFENNPDFQFNLRHCVDWEAIVPLRENNFEDAEKYKKTSDSALELAPANTAEAVDGYMAAFEAVGAIAGNDISAAARPMDKKGLKLQNGQVIFPEESEKLVNLLVQAGVLGYSVGRQYGGLRMTLTASSAILELISRADAAFGITVGCYNLAEVIERFCDEETQKKYIPKMATGEMIGAMALTEPNYGSDLSRVMTKAEKQPDGTYLMNGTKRFITHGCGLNKTPSVILTLARSGGAGAKGLSFFLVEGDQVQVARIEEKMGLHVSPTCEIVYENSKAYLIGEEGRGLVKYAMDMMNGARMGIAVQSLGIAQSAYDEGKKYASERVQFGVPIAELPAVARILQESSALIHGMRALVYRSCEVVDRYDGLVHKLHHEGADERSIRKNESVVKWDKLAKLLTPTAKLFTSEYCNKVAYDNLQIFGGSGYTEEYDIAKIYRDARITTIYEGTSQLQAIAAIGGLMEGVREGGTVLSYLQEEAGKVKDAGIKKQLLADISEFSLSIPIYKARADKETFAMDVVIGFAFLFSSILLAQHAEIAEKNMPGEFHTEKKKAFTVFNIMSRRYLAGLQLQIRN